MSFAKVNDIEKRWRKLTADEADRAETMLEDASNVLSALVEVDEGDEDQAAILKQVCCHMVMRSMVASASDAFGVSELQATMGPFGQTAHYSNPNGDMYLTKLEKKLLGIGGSKGRIFHPGYGVVRDDQLPDAL